MARPRFAVAPVWFILAAHFGLHFFTLSKTVFGIHRDEYLYFSMGRHLRLWHMDFPPLIAILARASQSLFDHTLSAARVFPAFEGAAIIVLAALIARELGGGGLAQALAALCVLCGPLFQRSSTLFQPVVLDQLWWTLGLYWLIRISRDDRPAYWIQFGAAMGLGLLTKFSILFFGFSVLLALLATPARRWLGTRWAWISALIAFAIGAPSIVGQVALDFPVVSQLKDLQGEQLTHVGFLDFIIQQPLMIGPAPFLLAIAGAGALVGSRRWRQFAVAGWTCIFAFLLLLVLRGKPYYIGPVYPALFAAGGVMLDQVSSRAGLALKATAFAVTIAWGAVSVPLGVPLLSPQETARYAERLGVSSAVRTNEGMLEELPQDFADMLGWEGQVRTVADVVFALDPAEREQAVILAGNYGEAGAAEFHGELYGLPPVVSPAGSFWFFGPGDKPGTVLVAVGVDSTRLAAAYGEVEMATVYGSPWSVEEERHVPILVARKPKRTLQEIWPSLAGIN